MRNVLFPRSAGPLDHPIADLLRVPARMVLCQVVIPAEISQVIGTRFFEDTVRDRVVFVAAFRSAGTSHEPAGGVAVCDERFECPRCLVGVG